MTFSMVAAELCMEVCAFNAARLPDRQVYDEPDRSEEIQAKRASST